MYKAKAMLFEGDYSPEDNYYDQIDRECRDAFQDETGYELYDGYDAMFQGPISVDYIPGTGRHLWRTEQIQYWARRIRFFFHRIKKICDEITIEQSKGHVSSYLMQSHAHYSMLYHKIKRDIRMHHHMVCGEILDASDIADTPI
jgi:hypothetical protein